MAAQMVSPAKEQIIIIFQNFSAIHLALKTIKTTLFRNNNNKKTFSAKSYSKYDINNKNFVAGFSCLFFFFFFQNTGSKDGSLSIIWFIQSLLLWKGLLYLTQDWSWKCKMDQFVGWGISRTSHQAWVEFPTVAAEPEVLNSTTENNLHWRCMMGNQAPKLCISSGSQVLITFSSLVTEVTGIDHWIW